MSGQSSPQKEARSICAILPAYNEGENLPELIPELAGVLDSNFCKWRILVVDDGSTDDTPSVLVDLSNRVANLSSIRLRRNSGKSDALQTAFESVDTDLVLLMDADGQDDPAEIPTLLAAMDEGFDLVTGRRLIRHDRIVKRNTSKLYNFATNRLTGVTGRDFNSGYKLMRSEVAAALNMYGELHRYIPVLASWSGFKVTETDVNHRARLHGSSKFGRNRFWRGLLDLVTVKFLTTYDARPFHLIGGAGLIVFFAGLALLAWMLVERVVGEAVGNRPALLAGVTLTVVGVQLVSMGLIAELMVAMSRRARRDDSGASVQR